MPSVYLAGPISGLSFDASETWRHEFKRHVGHALTCLSPLRGKDYLRANGVIEQSYEAPLSTDRGIMTRDHFDCSRADLIVCNLTGTERVSVGTVMEIAWAFAYRKPLILIMEPGNVHDHPMVREAVGFRASDVEEAALLALGILTP
jgi:nucleoside 2-deoxyribosyltransferase